MTHKKLLAGAAILLALAGCESTTATPAAGANTADAAFITDAYQIIQFDQQEGQIAQKQAKDPRVKAIAARLMEEANNYAEQIGPLARQAGIKPPTILRYDLRVRLGHMQIQNGLDFDRTYLDDQIASHEEAVRNEEMMNPATYSQGLMSLSQSGNSLIRNNLADLRSLRAQIGGQSR